MLAWPSLVTHPHESTPLVSGVKHALTIWFELPLSGLELRLDGRAVTSVAGRALVASPSMVARTMLRRAGTPLLIAGRACARWS